MGILSAPGLQSPSWVEKWVGGGIWERARARNGLDNAQPSSSTSIPSCLQLSQLLGSSLRLGKAWRGLTQKYHFGHLYFGVCRQCFRKAEVGVGIFQHDGAAAPSPAGGERPPSSSLPVSGPGFPLFPSFCLSQAWGSSGCVCVCSSGDDPNSCTERSQAREAGKTTQEYPKSPGISRMSQEELAAR